MDVLNLPESAVSACFLKTRPDRQNTIGSAWGGVNTPAHPLMTFVLLLTKTELEPRAG